MNREAESVIRDIILKELALDSQDIWIRSQNVEVLADKGVYYIVGMVDAKIISNTNNPVSTGSGMSDVIEIQSRVNILIDVVSSDIDALSKRWEMLAALVSTYSRQQQEIESFRILSIPTSFINTSSAEGGSEINRFSITIPCFTWYRKEQAITDDGGGDVYETFDTRVDDEETIATPSGIIEFTI